MIRNAVWWAARWARQVYRQRFGIVAATAILSASHGGLSWGQSYTMTTVAGGDRVRDGELATTVPLDTPFGFAQDAAGNVFIVDISDQRVRWVHTDGTLTTIAGTGVAGFSGDGGPGNQAMLNTPTSVALSRDETVLYIADRGNTLIRAVDIDSGLITTVAGIGRRTASGDGGSAQEAGMDPVDLAVDQDDNLYVADYTNNRIRKIDALSWTITTIAGDGTSGDAPASAVAVSAPVFLPLGIALDANRRVYIAELGNQKVRLLDQSSGMMTLVAGGGTVSGSSNPLQTDLLGPSCVAVDADGNLLICTENRIWSLGSSGLMTAIMFTRGGFRGDGGPAIDANFGFFGRVTVARNGDILVGDADNDRVRRVRDGIVNTIAGTGPIHDVPATSTFLNGPAGLVSDGAGGFIFADRDNNQIRRVEAGQLKWVFGDGFAYNDFDRVNQPEAVSRDGQGNIYIADSGNNRVLRIAAGNLFATVVAGGAGQGFSGDNGPAVSSRLFDPTDVLASPSGVIYIADYNNCRVRAVKDGTIRTVVGHGDCILGEGSNGGDGGPAVDAEIDPYALALQGPGDGAGQLYISDRLNDRVRMVDLASGVISTVAGRGTSGYSGDGGPADLAELGLPEGIAVNEDGDLFIAEYRNSVVRLVRDGSITTIAGVAGEFETTAESGPAISIPFDPVRIEVAPDGALWVSDGLNSRIRRLELARPDHIDIVNGDGGTGNPGDRLELRVRVLDELGANASSVPVQFEVTEGTAAVVATSGRSNLNGIAAATVRLGGAPGRVVVTARVEGVLPVTFLLTVNEITPIATEGGLVGAGLSVPSIQAVSTGAILTVFGQNFGADVLFQKVGDADLVEGRVPTKFLGICVEMNGERAPVFGASNTQVNFQSIAVTEGVSYQVVVITGCDESYEKRTGAVQVAAQSATPEFFYFTTSLTGDNPVAATDTLTGAPVASAALFPGSGIQPIRAGQYVTIYGTGFGVVDPFVTPGTFPAVAGEATGEVHVYLNGAELAAENILYVGVTPNSPGLYQLNLLLPSDTPEGELSLVIEIGGVRSPEGAFLAVVAGG